MKLYCWNNEIIELTNLPNTLVRLYCWHNKITKLSNLPNALNILYCSNNKLTELTNLPSTLIILYCIDNKLTKLANLPDTLKNLRCYNNNLLFTDIESLIKLDNFIKFFNLNKLLKLVFLYAIKKRCLKYKEELIIKSCHPSRLSFI